MSYSYIYEPRAIIEFENAFEWYWEQSHSAAENFESRVKEKIHDICSNPFLYRKIRKHFREVHLKKYPFSIVYSVNEETLTIIIMSIFHHRRNPKRKYTA